MNIDFSSEVTLGTISSIIVFMGGIGLAIFRLGIYIAKITTLLTRFEEFAEESIEDRKDLRKRLEEKGKRGGTHP